MFQTVGVRSVSVDTPSERAQVCSDTMYKTDHFARMRLARFGRRDVAMLAEALVGLSAASVSVRFVPFKRITSAITRQAISKRPRAVNLGQLRWAVQAIARRIPLRAMCFEQALCLQAMLRRRGVASTLHYGVRWEEEGALGAHVWLSVDGELVLGGECASRYACVASFATPVH